MAKVTETKFTSEHWDVAAEFVNSEYMRRKNRRVRKEKERIWNEVDRQVRMEPLPLRVDDPKDKNAATRHHGHHGLHLHRGTRGTDNWFPNTELPLQASALEVLQADANKLTFPQGAEWFVVHSEITDDFANKFQQRREKVPFIGGTTVPMQMDQETADVLVKSTLDHFHHLFNFRDTINFLDVEALKFGTYAARVQPAMQPTFSSDLRGVMAQKAIGPAVIPVSIRRLYLDDTPQAVMMEGVSLQPAHIREFWQRKEDLVLAAQQSGQEGYIKSQIDRIELSDPDSPVHMLEYEGDLVIPTSQDHIYLPNSVLTVAISEGGPLSVRYRENTDGFRSYVTGVYEREDLDSPYGTSPLMKGQPIQELGSLMANRLAAVVALSAQPPALYDPSDAALQRAGGPRIAPNSKQPSDNPLGSVNFLDDWNISDTAAALTLILGLYEDLTGVTAPRRGAQTKSHTTAFAVDVENSRGLVRTDDYVQAKEKGPLTSILQREYRIIKKKMTPTSVFVGTAGIEGYVKIAKEDLPENAQFDVIGSAGPATERERQQLRQVALEQAANLSGISQQQGGPQLNFEEAMKEILNVFENPDRFVTSPQGVPNAASGLGGVPGPAGMVSGPQSETA